MEYQIFPVKKGFEVQSVDDYRYLIKSIFQQTVELIEEFPDKYIWVVYETEQGTN